MRRMLFVALLLVLGSIGSAHAFNGTCSLQIPDANFGALLFPVTSTSQIDNLATISCTGITDPYIKYCGLSIGAGVSGDINNRAIVSDGHRFQYSIMNGGNNQVGSIYYPGSQPLATSVYFSPDGNGNYTNTLLLSFILAAGQTAAYAGNYQDSYAGTEAEFRYSTCSNANGDCMVDCSNNASLYKATTTSFRVSGTLAPVCQFSTARNWNLGSVGLITAPIQFSRLMLVTCTVGLPYTVSSSAGSETSGTSTVADRVLATAPLGPDLVHYNLFTDAGMSSIFGDGSQGTSVITGTGTGAAVSYQIYGAIPVPARQVAPGLYRSVVPITITY
ncbi:spore coat U domain-containing protein [Ralstonia pseudosolanacearum]|uniref:Spore coat U domain-containing protein n=1 Tax=Ralstonia pseudosolanacearum TaxID=1310165 RepID=A0A454TLN1_9RALS|nr:spore coat U domain-containing protein [Ralstonia pseudosolanacearum]